MRLSLHRTSLPRLPDSSGLEQHSSISNLVHRRHAQGLKCFIAIQLVSIVLSCFAGARMISIVLAGRRAMAILDQHDHLQQQQQLVHFLSTRPSYQVNGSSSLQGQPRTVPVFLDAKGQLAAILVTPKQYFQMTQTQFDGAKYDQSDSKPSSTRGNVPAFSKAHKDIAQRSSVEGQQRQESTTPRRSLSIAPSSTLFSNPTAKNLKVDSTSSGSGILFVAVASSSLIMGALLAKRILKRWQKWEQQSREDSLAYDLAYMDTFSDVGYGSFVSATWSDDLERFEI